MAHSTWHFGVLGAPYDPQAFAVSWSYADEAYYAALQGFPEPNTHTVLHQRLRLHCWRRPTCREQAWTEILSIMHGQATDYRLGRRSGTDQQETLWIYPQGTSNLIIPYTIFV